MINENDLHALSEQHIREVYRDYRNAQPFEVGQHLKLHDEEGQLFAIAECLRIWWSDREWDWLLECLIVEGNHRWTEYVSAGQCVRHVGFMARLV